MWRCMQTKEAIRLFINSRRAKHLSPDTIRWYKGILELFARDYPTLTLNPEDIESFILNCQAGDERTHGYFRALRAFYRFLHRRQGIFNPVNMIDPPKRKPKHPRHLTVDELDQLLSFPHREDIRAALLFLADSGARVGELFNLKKEDLRVTPWGYVADITGKTGSRLVPISNITYRSLMAILPFHFGIWRFRRLISFAFDDAHIKGSAHTLRHTFGTLWEGDELILQQIMGHAHLSSTILYRHLRTERMSAQHNQFSPLNLVFSRTRSML